MNDNLFDYADAFDFAQNLVNSNNKTQIGDINMESTEKEQITYCDRCGNRLSLPAVPGAPNTINIYSDSVETTTEGIVFHFCRTCMNDLYRCIGGDDT